MKQILVMLSMALFVITLEYQTVYAQTNDVMQAIMRDGELTDLIVEKTSMRPWCKGTTDIKGKLEEIKGLQQYVVIQGIKVLILYGEFNNNDEAHRAAIFVTVQVKETAKQNNPGWTRVARAGLPS